MNREIPKGWKIWYDFKTVTGMYRVDLRKGQTRTYTSCIHSVRENALAEAINSANLADHLIEVGK